MGSDLLVVESIEAEDFLSYYQSQTIMLGGRGPLAVVGDNGAGKSTLVSKALAWGLYGSCAPERMGSGTKAMKGREVIRNRELPEHMATPKAKSAHVRIRLRRGATVYMIYRIRPSSGGDKISVDRLEPTADHLGNQQADIDNIVGVPYAMFVKTCLRGQGDPWNFAEATDKRKREILDTISGADSLTIPHGRAVELRKRGEAQAGTYAARVEDAERRMAAVDPSEAATKRDSWEQQRQQRLQAAAQEHEVLDKAWQHAMFEDQRAERTREPRAQIEAERPTLDLAPYEDAILKLRTDYAAQRASLAAFEANVAKAQQLVAAGRCPHCAQVIDANNQAGGAIHHLANTNFDKRRQELEALEARGRNAIGVRDQAVAWLRDAEAEWSARLQAMPLPGPARRPAAERAARQAELRVAEIRDAQNPWTEVVAGAEAQRRDLEREAMLLREAETGARRRASLAGAWEAALAPKGVRAHLAEGALAAIEAEANRWLAVLSSGQMAVSFPPTRTTQRGDAREEIQTIIQVGESTRPLLTYSGGEKRRINLAVDLGVALAFSRGGALALSLLVLDEEIFSGMDEDGKAGVVTALHHAGVADVVIIDHDPRLTGVLPRTVKVYRGPDGYSRIEEASC